MARFNARGAQGELEDLREEINRLREQISKRATSVGQEIESSGRQALKSAEHEVEQNPLVSVLSAFGLGLLMGLVFGMFRRR